MNHVGNADSIASTVIPREMLLQVELAVGLNRDPCNQAQLEKFNPLLDSFVSNILLAAALTAMNEHAAPSISAHN